MALLKGEQQMRGSTSRISISLFFWQCILDTPEGKLMKKPCESYKIKDRLLENAYIVPKQLSYLKQI